jgi:hypothetical protein
MPVLEPLVADLAKGATAIEGEQNVEEVIPIRIL